MQDANKQDLLAALSAWNSGDADRFNALVADDIILRSPYIPTGELSGRNSVVDWIKGRQFGSSNLDFVDILAGADTLSILLRDKSGFVIWQLSFSGSVVHQICVSYSVGPTFGDPE